MNKRELRFHFSLWLLLAFVLPACSSAPDANHVGSSTGAYARKMDQVHMAQARRFLAQGENGKARVELSQLSADAQTASMHLLLAEAFFREANVYAANEEIALAAELEPENPKVDQLQGMIAESRGDWQAAAQAYLRASAKDRDHVDSLLAYVRVLHAMGDAARAASFLETEMAGRPVNFDLSMAAGETYLSLGSYQQAVAQFSQALELQPDNAKAKEQLSFALSLSGAHQEALDLSMTEDGKSWAPATQLALGRSALLAGQTHRAATLLHLYLGKFETEPSVWLDFARAEFLEQQDIQALEALSRCLKLQKQNAAAFTLLGHIRLRAKQYDLAFAAYERAIQAGGDALVLTELMDQAKIAREREEGKKL